MSKTATAARVVAAAVVGDALAFVMLFVWPGFMYVDNVFTFESVLALIIMLLPAFLAAVTSEGLRGLAKS